MNGFSTISLYWIQTNLILWLLEDNTLPNFECKNIAIKNSASKNLLVVIIDNKLDFTERRNTASKNANLRLHALNRISRFLAPEQQSKQESNH